MIQTLDVPTQQAHAKSMPMRRCRCSFWAALLLGLAQLAAGSPLLRSNAGAIMTPAAAQSKEISRPMSLWARASTTRSSGGAGGWSSARGAATAVAGVGTLLSGSGSSAGRGLALGVLLASPHLAAARPLEAANTSVVPFSEAFAQTRRVLTGYAMDDSNIYTAVTAWFADNVTAEATYGHISTWDTSAVTSMVELFCWHGWCSYKNEGAGNFNADISAWDVSGFTLCGNQIYGAFVLHRRVDLHAINATPVR